MATQRPSVPRDRILIDPAERGDAVLDAIASARQRIRLSLFRCSDKRVFAALKAAVERKVDVRVMMTSRAKGGRKKLEKLWSRLEDTGAMVCAYNDPVVKYHAKYLVVDDGPALVATFNFTRKCFTRTTDALVITWDAAVVSGLQALLHADSINQPAPDTLTERLIVGPERARRQFTRLIAEARHSVCVVDSKLADPAIVSLLAERRAAGVAVEIHDARRIGDRKSHGKLMLVDDRIAIVGSLALTALSLDFRREVALACEEPEAVKNIRQLFRTLSETPGTDRPQEPTRAGGPSC